MANSRPWSIRPSGSVSRASAPLIDAVVEVAQARQPRSRRKVLTWIDTSVGVLAVSLAQLAHVPGDHDTLVMDVTSAAAVLEG